MQDHAPGEVCLTVDGLGVVSLRVVEPIRPLLYLHPPAWADPELARRRLTLYPSVSHSHTTKRALTGMMVMTMKKMLMVVQDEVNRAGACFAPVLSLAGSLLPPEQRGIIGSTPPKMMRSWPAGREKDSCFDTSTEITKLGCCANIMKL